MNFKRIYAYVILIPLLALSCGGNKIHVEVPPPDPIVNPDDGGGSGEGGGSGSGTGEGGGTGTGTGVPSGEWDKNRGKVVTPSGAGWTSSTVRDGIIYYAFTGTDPVTGVKQNVRAVSVDLTKTDYQIKLVRSAPAVKTSEVHSREGAIATMNAGYEAGSIYIRVNGTAFSVIPNTEIGTTGVRNWKSEAAFFGDRGRGVAIRPADDPLIRPYQSPEKSQMSTFIRTERNYYASCTEADVISSSPLLVYDYWPVGETFIDTSISNWSSLNTEEPQYHQRKRHPRSAIGITEDKRFIMLVVDGRQNSLSLGMSAKELTLFFVKNFNPQYALNMDGGGSTAMCVEGLGNASTHVVNSPIQDNIPGNERARDTHFVITASK